MINSGSRFCTQRGAGVEKMFAVAGSEFVLWRKNTWTRYRPCLTCQMVIKIHIYISKEGHMAGKSFTHLTKKKITYNNGTVFIKKTYLEKHKKMFFFSTSLTQN